MITALPRACGNWRIKGFAGGVQCSLWESSPQAIVLFTGSAFDAQALAGGRLAWIHCRRADCRRVHNYFFIYIFSESYIVMRHVLRHVSRGLFCFVFMVVFFHTVISVFCCCCCCCLLLLFFFFLSFFLFLFETVL